MTQSDTEPDYREQAIKMVAGELNFKPSYIRLLVGENNYKTPSVVIAVRETALRLELEDKVNRLEAELGEVKEDVLRWIAKCQQSEEVIQEALICIPNAEVAASLRDALLAENKEKE